jgi:D-alanyl-D-alanine carboxypeptidase
VSVVMSKQLGGGQACPPRPRSLGTAVFGAIVALALCGATPAGARHWHSAAGPVAAYAPAFEWIVLDAETGQVLGERNADVQTYPASLTKMMTLYLTFDALNQGRITLDTRFNVSSYAASRAPSKLALEPGDSVPVRDLILGIVTKSANDAAAVLAEGLAGSEANFSRDMTWKARQLGMARTYYANASGLPDPQQQTTARDVARLALSLYHQFPREYRYFATREFDFRGQIVHGHDHLLDWYPGADGIKTGYVNASGFNLATSAVQNGHRLIGVVMGGRTARVRDVQMASLLDQGFAILNRGQPAQPAGTTLVAAAPPAAAPPPPSPVPAAMPQQTAAVRQTPATTTAQATPSEQKPGLLHTALRHLAPVSRAEAAPLSRQTSDGDDWAIQIGAFRAPAAAAHAAHEVAHLAVARGKPHQILPPARAERQRLYRARLLHFTEKSAQAACAELRHRGFACAVLRPDAARLAS